MKTYLVILSLTALSLTGCHSYDTNSTKPVRYADGVQVISIDSTPRKFSPTLEVFQNADELKGRPYHKIALLSRNGWPDDEGRLINAVIWKAKSIGANGVIMQSPVKGNYEFNAFARSGKRTTYKAEAIVFDASK